MVMSSNPTYFICAVFLVSMMTINCSIAVQEKQLLLLIVSEVLIWQRVIGRVCEAGQLLTVYSTADRLRKELVAEWLSQLVQLLPVMRHATLCPLVSNAVPHCYSTTFDNSGLIGLH